MKHILQSAVLLVIGLAVFFNIERLDIAEENVVDLDTFVYIIGLAAVISVILIPILRQSRTIVSIGLWTIIYLIAKLIVYYLNDRPIFGGVYTYLTITELVFLLGLIWISHNFAAGLQEFQEAVKRITFSETNRQLRLFNNADEDIQIEMFRSRHNHRPLSVIVVQPEADSIQTTLHLLVQDIQHKMLSNYVINNMAQTLSKYLRRTDFILEQRDKGQFIVVCPETSAEDSMLLVEYIQTVTKEQLGISVVYGTATFPDEALTFEELLSQAEAKL